MNYVVLIDVEGVTGVTTYAQAEASVFGIDMLMSDLNSLLKGLLSTGENTVVLYEQHTDGCNVRLEELPDGVSVIRGKPTHWSVWRDLGMSVDGLIMLGFHAKAGEGTLLAHSYMPWNRDIRVNGVSYGELGIETAMAGEAGVPLVLATGDSAGMAEALTLSAGALTVTVKESIGDSQAICYPPAQTRRLMEEAGRKLCAGVPATPALKIEGPVVLEVDLTPGAYLTAFAETYPALVSGETVTVRADSVIDAWLQYLQKEEELKATL